MMIRDGRRKETHHEGLPAHAKGMGGHLVVAYSRPSAPFKPAKDTPPRWNERIAQYQREYRERNRKARCGLLMPRSGVACTKIAGHPDHCRSRRWEAAEPVQICGALMPRIKESCSRGVGHGGDHRSRYALDNETQNKHHYRAGVSSTPNHESVGLPLTPVVGRPTHLHAE